MRCRDERIEQRIMDAGRLWLFLDYDGTLAEFSETPDQIEVQSEIVELVTHLAKQPGVRTSIVSGRSLEHIRKLVPVHGVLLAGTYGLEYRSFEGEDLFRLEFENIRPILEDLKPQLEALISGKEGFFLEDKGWSLAIHARYASDDDAEQVLNAAHQMMSQLNEDLDLVILGGYKFLEICPGTGNKGSTVRNLLVEYPWAGALLVYLGDDDKDEEAFRVIEEQGGVSIRVGSGAEGSQADCHLEDPKAARHWLNTLIKWRENNGTTQ